MSKITEMAKAEAEAAEAENPDGDEDGEGEPSAEPDEGDAEAQEEADADVEGEDGPASAEDMEAALDTEAARHLVALESLMPDFRDVFEPCPQCGRLGYVMQGRPPMDEGLDECPKCKGYGVVQTPSRAEGHVFEQCSQCHGNGHIIKVTPLPAVTPTFQPQVTMPPGNGQAKPAWWDEAVAAGYIITPTTPPPVPS